MSRGYIHCVLREPEFSPGKVEHDAAILLETAAQLAAKGFDVGLRRAGEPLERNGHLPTLVLAMCQGPSALVHLEERAQSVVVINPPSAIANCYRERMIALLGGAGLRFAPAAVMDTGGTAALALDPPVWIKRADVHAMEPGDVVYAATRDQAVRALGALYQRGIRRAVLQRHVEGTVVKFYAVAQGEFFRCRQAAGALEYRLADLQELAGAAASRLGLAVYGGDAVIDQAGQATLIDVNDWPSFSWCRADAARAIAEYVAKRCNGIQELGRRQDRSMTR